MTLVMCIIITSLVILRLCSSLHHTFPTVYILYTFFFLFHPCISSFRHEEVTNLIQSPPSRHHYAFMSSCNASLIVERRVQIPPQPISLHRLFIDFSYGVTGLVLMLLFFFYYRFSRLLCPLFMEKFLR